MFLSHFQIHYNMKNEKSQGVELKEKGREITYLEGTLERKEGKKRA